MKKLIEDIIKKSENTNLTKATLVTLATLCVLFAGISARLSLKDPLIIERSCESSKALQTTNAKRERRELDNFFRAALAERFDSEKQESSELLSMQMLKARELEQVDLKKSGLKQRVLFNSFVENDGNFVIDSDRLVRSASQKSSNLRSVFAFTLIARVEESNFAPEYDSYKRNMAKPKVRSEIKAKPQYHFQV